MKKETLYSPETLIDLVLSSDVSIRKVAKDANVPLPTIKNYVYGKTEPASMSYRIIKALTDFFRNEQSLEIMLQDYDCVMLEGTLLPGRDLPHIENPQLHAFKTLSELVYRSKLKYENELSQVEPFLVVLSEELLYFFQSGFNSMFIADMIKDAKKYNLKFVTAEDILMDVRLANLRDRLQPFVKCRDINGLKKLATLDKISELPQRIFSGITCDMSIMSKYAYYITVGVNSNRIGLEVYRNLEPGCLNSFSNDTIMSNPKPKNETISIIFDTLTSKFDFITAIALSDYDNLFHNKNPYYTQSQFSGETIDSLGDSRILFAPQFDNITLGSIDNNIGDIINPIRPNHFDMNKFIMDKHVDITKNMVINVADRFFHESDDYTHIERYVIHSIEYTDLNGKKCIYQS